tara:strand:+ start:1063 stop:1563 length:501 start_codon:yes stop_codon:yes gene_type:complete
MRANFLKKNETFVVLLLVIFPIYFLYKKTRIEFFLKKVKKGLKKAAKHKATNILTLGKSGMIADIADGKVPENKFKDDVTGGVIKTPQITDITGDVNVKDVGKKVIKTGVDVGKKVVKTGVDVVKDPTGSALNIFDKLNPFKGIGSIFFWLFIAACIGIPILGMII